MGWRNILQLLNSENSSYPVIFGYHQLCFGLVSLLESCVQGKVSSSLSLLYYFIFSYFYSLCMGMILFFGYNYSTSVSFLSLVFQDLASSLFSPSFYTFLKFLEAGLSFTILLYSCLPALLFLHLIAWIRQGILAASLSLSIRFFFVPTMISLQ